MNRPLRRISLGVLILLGALMANLSYIQAFQADELNNNPGNARQITQVFSVPRGQIIADDTVLAHSVEVEGSRWPYQRQYPHGLLYASATGHLSSRIGSSGIEEWENTVLSGEDLRQKFRKFFNTSSTMNTGGNVYLTLEPALQQAAAQALGDKRGAVVALDPSTGAILAMVTSPTYDPNTLAVHDGDQQQHAWDTLNAASAKPALNRALNQTQPPGSTFKLVTAAAAIENLGLTPLSSVFGEASIPLPQTTNTMISNYDKRPCTPESDTTTLMEALRRSCNTTFAELSMQMGDDVMNEQADKFGFNRVDLRVPLMVSESKFPTEMSKASTAQSSIGQYDVKATPLQMAMVAAGIANDGEVMRPYLVKRTTTASGATLSTTRAQVLSEAISSETATMMREMMVQVVNNGTGTNAQISGITVAGKTGTAQTGTQRSNHAWFVSFAPAGQHETPEVAVAVLLEEGGGGDVSNSEISGGRLAAPIARAVMEAKLK